MYRCIRKARKDSHISKFLEDSRHMEHNKYESLENNFELKLTAVMLFVSLPLMNIRRCKNHFNLCNALGKTIHGD